MFQFESNRQCKNAGDRLASALNQHTKRTGEKVDCQFFMKTMGDTQVVLVLKFFVKDDDLLQMLMGKDAAYAIDVKYFCEKQEVAN